MVEPAKAADLVPIKSLLEDCDLPFDELTAAHLAHFFVIRENGGVVGSVGLEIRENLGLLRSLAVAESQRGLGCGIRLANQIEAHARSLNLQAIYLLTTTAEKFFAPLGYQITDRRSAPRPLQETAEFKSICPASAVCMAKNL